MLSCASNSESLEMFKCALLEGNPTAAMNCLIQRIKKTNLEQDKSTAISFIKDMSEHFKEIYHSFFQAEKGLTIIRNMHIKGLSLNPETLKRLAGTMLNAIQGFQAATVNESYFMEEAYVEYNRLIQDYKMSDFKSNFMDREAACFELILRKLIEPHLDVYFQRIKKYYTYRPNDVGMKAIFVLKMTDISEYKSIMDCSKSLRYLQLDMREIQGQQPHWYENEIASTMNYLDINLQSFYVLVKAISAFDIRCRACQTMLQQGTVAPIFPSIRAILMLSDEIEEFKAKLREVEDKFREKSRQIKKKRKKGKKSNNGTIPELEQLKNLTIEESPIEADESISEVSTAAIVEPIYSSSSSSSLSSSASHSTDVGYAAPLLFSDKAKEKPRVTLSSNSQKVLDAIFEGTDVKYQSFVNFIENTLGGCVNDKSKSSSRKIEIPKGNSTITYGFHQRHNRDRADCLDPKCVKKFKIILESLDIVPDWYRESIKPKYT